MLVNELVIQITCGLDIHDDPVPLICSLVIVVMLTRRRNSDSRCTYETRLVYTSISEGVYTGIISFFFFFPFLFKLSLASWHR